MDEFKNRLREANERVTSARLSIFKTISRKGPITTTRLVELLANNGVDPATTYRNLNMFRKLHMIKDINFRGRQVVEVSDEYEGHHHHFWCTNCGRVKDFDSAKIEKALADSAQEFGFKISSHQVEATGKCSDCK